MRSVITPELTTGAASLSTDLRFGEARIVTSGDEHQLLILDLAVGGIRQGCGIIHAPYATMGKLFITPGNASQAAWPVHAGTPRCIPNDFRIVGTARCTVAEPERFLQTVAECSLRWIIPCIPVYSLPVLFVSAQP
jgi:hypothetical protein